MEIDKLCPRGHGELMPIEGLSRKADGCGVCIYVHYSREWQSVKSTDDGNTWERADGLYLYDGKRDEWVKVPA